MIRTDRLRLRPMALADLDELVALHAEPEVVRFMGSLDREQAIERLDMDRRDWSERGHGLMAITEHGNGRFLGRTGLKYWPEFGETEVGWVLRTDVWGQGLANEAAAACVRWGFENLSDPYFTAMIRPDNARSIKVAERLQMTPLRDDELLEMPVVVYWLERPSPVG